MKSTVYTIKSISEILHAQTFLNDPEAIITDLVIDSRKITDPENALFFAIKAQKDGHHYVSDAYNYGVRNFIVSDAGYTNKYPDANFLLVTDTLIALQSLAARHRSGFSFNVIGITGSNGKTIVKEWLYQLLAADYNIVRSPKSFNSQIGVPLSVWQINGANDLAIFEAGISKEGEMDNLERVIKPTIGILTNLTAVHAEGFESETSKLEEKLKLFKDAELLIYSPDYVPASKIAALPGKNKFTWSTKNQADLQIFDIEPIQGRHYLRAYYLNAEIECLIPFADLAAVENGIICWATLLALGYSPEEADKRLEKLSSVSMRLELKNGINNCSVIDDSYSADIASLAIALDFLNQQNQHLKKTIILSDIYETGKNKTELYKEVAQLLHQKNVASMIGIGPDIASNAAEFKSNTIFFQTTQEFIAHFPELHFANESILVKGARKFEFERISKLLTQKIHDTVLEVDLTALTANLNYYRSKLQPGVKLMAMVKAFSYGSGSFEIANLLQFHKVDYLAVAYADEGIALRQAGITMPIMVMSPEPSAFSALISHQLEPELYSTDILKKFIDFLPSDTKNYPVHIKIDTGMHRLGFDDKETDDLIAMLQNTDQLKVISIFSHLAGSGSADLNDFTTLQIEKFKAQSSKIENAISYSPLKHILNTSGITTRPDAQFDMVRLGIGLYGYDTALNTKKVLQTVAVLKTTVTQVKELLAHETVGYGRSGVMPNGGKIATVKIGYADGYSRAFGNGVGKMLVNGILVPTIGSICMDMSMLDVSGLEVKTGDEVIVFNDELTISHLASQINTIPYEILTNISQRVKRVYFYE